MKSREKHTKQKYTCLQYERPSSVQIKSSSGVGPEHVSQASTMEKGIERTLNRSSHEPASQIDAEEETQI